MQIDLDDLINKIYYDTKKQNLGGHFFFNYCFKNLSRYLKVTSKAKINILIVNAPCNGFGDIIFAAKIYDYVKLWYPHCKIQIATTQPKAFVSIGFDPKNILDLNAGNRTQCRKLARLTKPNNIVNPDIYLVAPVMADFYPDIKDLSKLFPQANSWNTYFFSEYNDSLTKNFTFDTGIGNGRDGLLFTSFSNIPPRLVENPYALSYVAESIGGVGTCLLAFFLMVTTKYHKKYPIFDIIVPPWFSNHTKTFKQITKKIKHLYPNILLILKNKDIIIISRGYPNANTLTFRADILPVPNKSMISLMRYSVKDILLTGDQSITDALACCPEKNIFYQIAPWKADFAENLARLLPNIYLRNVNTSCGTLKALSYKSNYKNFIKTHDFRTIAKSKMNNIILIGMILKYDSDVKLLSDIVNSSRSMRTIKNEIDQNFNSD